MVEEALNRAMKNRTCIKIAHRISTVRNADRIVVLSDGRIAEWNTFRAYAPTRHILYAMNNFD